MAYRGNLNHHLCDRNRFVLGLLSTLVFASYVDSSCSNDSGQWMYSETHTPSLTEILPNSFVSCSSLVRVDLSYNSISKLSNQTFEALYKLEYLDLSHNKITSLPSGLLATQRNLNVLNVSHNMISTLPVDFLANKYRLTYTDFSYNKIQTIHLDAFKLFYSKTVNFTHNALMTFEPWPYVGKYNIIETFDLRWNNISTFSNNENWTFQQQPNTLVDLRHNAFTKWDDWSLMQYFDNPKSQSIHVVLGQLNVDLRDNNWNCDCNMHHVASLMKGDLYSYRIELLKLKCRFPPNLEGLSIFYDVNLNDLTCDVYQDCPTECECIDSPEDKTVSIDCRDRNLLKMPDKLPFKKYLNIELYLANNSISIFEERAYTQYISKLTLANNQLTVIDTVALKLMSNTIRYLDVHNNRLQSVPKEMQVLPFESVQLSNNPLKCDCDMTWMASWIKLAPKHVDKGLKCQSSKQDVYEVADITDTLLNCSHEVEIGIVVVCSIILAAVIILLVTAKRCPYETKVILYKLFRIHPSDKYEVDDEDEMEYDLYVSSDDDDIHVMQWVRRTLAKHLEETKKPRYKLFIPLRDLPRGIPEAETRLDKLEKSRRIVIILTDGYMKNEWNEYELHQSDILDKNEGRILYIVYDNDGKNLSKREPWRSKMAGRKVFSPDERLFWSKLRYELPIKKKPIGN